MRIVAALLLTGALLAFGIFIGSGLRRDPPPVEVERAALVSSQPTAAPPQPTPAPPPSTPPPPVAIATGSDDIPAAFAALGLTDAMPYADARAKLASGGYSPAPVPDRDCASIGEAECAAFPEIEACSGTGAGFCSARYGRGGVVYNVITQGPGGPLVRVFAAVDSQPR